MEKLFWPWLMLLVATVPGKALDLNGTREIGGTWKAAVTLPCAYEPSPGFREENVVWKSSQQDHGPRTIFRRDGSSGDQTLLVSFQGRLSVPKQPPGDVSLIIKDLEMTDSGHYTCEVTWQSGDQSMITQEWTTTLRVKKVPVTKPFVRLSSAGSFVVSGTRLTMTCVASGSPRITYRWYKEMPGGNRLLVEAAILDLGVVGPRDGAKYYCEAENRISTQASRSDPVLLTVIDHPVTTQGPEIKWDTTKNQAATSSVSGNALSKQVSRRAVLPLYLIILIAILCAVVVFAAVSVIACRRRPKDGRIYQVTYNNSSRQVRREEGSWLGPVRACEFPYEASSPRVNNNYTTEPTNGSIYVPMAGKEIENEYEALVCKMESEYEVADGK
ncbi:V-set and immunoglobulin domain-containing protein 4 isoform X2 [Hemicordylus capensis]|uniref:V-set and immunoglobulin domain-containing protein 4 isoform X2 n=1 Tax=Hemicordylus capensis TaxID=884348 RepID=UPI002303EA37|nr:V-set and immunoglobulin domain-containing protein 4 isoform X2 [Hemicordylus capensis]